jgi:hypothetical protein
MGRWQVFAGLGTLVVLAVLAGPMPAGAAQVAAPDQGGGGLAPDYLDKLLAPVALYPDQLLAQVLLCAGDSRKVGELAAWLKKNAQLKGSDLQKAAQSAGFEPSFIALAPFPQVVDLMAGNLTWTSQLGGAFAVDKGAVFDSIQRLRAQSKAVGNLKSTPQQTVESKTTPEGQQVIVIEPANPQVIYVPQYNPQVVYTQAAPTTSTTTVVVKEDDDDDEAALAGALVGFTAGVVLGSAINNNYYGYHGGAYMYNSGWNNWYDDREDAREDWYENREDAREDYADHRENMGEERSERAEDAREQRGERSGEAQQQRTERTEQRGERSGEAQQKRTERQQSGGTPEAQAQREQRRTDAQSARASGTTQSTAAAGQRSGGERTRPSGERSGTRSDAFSGYSSGSSTRSSSARGERSRSRSSGGGGRSRRR